MKAKRKIAFSLVAIYLVSVIGLAMSLHFCGGKLAEVSFFKEKASCKICKNEAVAKHDDGCCHNAQIDIKVKDSHQSGIQTKIPDLIGFNLFFHPVVANILHQIFPIFLAKTENKAPPFTAQVSLHIFNCVFRN